MSLYIFGCISSDPSNQEILKKGLKELGTRLKVIISFDSLEEEDRKDLSEELRIPKTASLYFAVYSEHGESSATGLWIEANTLAWELLRKQGLDPSNLIPSQLKQTDIPESYYRGILSSRLGAFINGLTSSFAAFDFAIALVDGSIETVRNCGEGDCLREILASLTLPWDCTRNAVYVFHRKGVS